MDANKPRVAIADFAHPADSVKPHASLFTQVVRDDLQFSGILELASPSFYPPQAPSVPAELKPAIWIDPPTNANFLGFGNLSESTAEVAIEAWLYDERRPSWRAVVGKVYRGARTDAQMRKLAHQFAYEIISKLSGGLPGVPSTQIAFVSSSSGPQRLTMDYGASMSPSWNPKTGQSVAFVSDRGGTPQLYLMNSDGTSATKLDLPDKGYVIDPAWAPNGQLLAFSWRRPNDNYDIYVMDAATRQILELTRHQGRTYPPSWAPTGPHLLSQSPPLA